jgi:two-component system, NtrC family, response regulator AlgB
MHSAGHEHEGALLHGDVFPSRAAFESASPAMQSFGRLLAHAADHTVPVLLVGERGTGKTTFARALHTMSSRAARPFVRVDCPAAVDDLSKEAHVARSGTLFLDEVAELPPAVQAAALRLLQESRPNPFRLVASTRYDLEAEMAAGRFRKDLFYRLDVLEIRIPALRERLEDILPIARAFAASVAKGEGRAPPELSPEVERALLRYSWPGNVQELQGVLQRMLILSPGSRLEVAALPGRISG